MEKLLSELSQDKVSVFEECERVENMRICRQFSKMDGSHQNGQFKQVESTMECMVDRSDVETRDVNQLAINMGNYKTSSMPQEQEVAVKLDGSQFLIQYQILGIVIKYSFSWEGVSSIDNHYRLAPFEKNIRVLLVWFRILFLVYTAGASLPYYQAMEKFTAHSQYVNKESIDKGVSIDRMLFACKIVDVDLDEPIKMLFDPRITKFLVRENNNVVVDRLNIAIHGINNIEFSERIIYSEGKKLEMCGNVVPCFDRYMVECEKLAAHVYSFREVQYHKLLSTSKFQMQQSNSDLSSRKRDGREKRSPKSVTSFYPNRKTLIFTSHNSKYRRSAW
ncbi:hypothetical protein V6N11_016824 [Hibiscus sabdariffa]|uniref:Uncharacterized protein n=1 Tax=Hibiscus sabdariffa TaxID=183260 RepID=A0ABR2TWU2_9ROSI